MQFVPFTVSKCGIFARAHTSTQCDCKSLSTNSTRRRKKRTNSVQFSVQHCFVWLKLERFIFNSDKMLPIIRHVYLLSTFVFFLRKCAAFCVPHIYSNVCMCVIKRSDAIKSHTKQNICVDVCEKWWWNCGVSTTFSDKQYKTLQFYYRTSYKRTIVIIFKVFNFYLYV